MEVEKKSYTAPILIAFTTGFLASTILLWDTAKTKVQNHYLSRQNSQLREIVHSLKSENDFLVGFTTGRIYENIESQRDSSDKGGFYRDIQTFPDIREASDTRKEISKTNTLEKSLFDYRLSFR